jgi:galactitol-specific phosphotransferase system IIB component
MKYLDENGLLYVVQKIKTWLNGKVDKVDGKTLSTNDYTTAEKEKLAGLTNYTLPTASATTLGGIKVGAGLAINSGVLSATGGGTADSVDWANVQNRPTKVSQFTNDSGYQTSAQVEATVTSKGYQTASDVNTIVNNVVGAAPEALNTLKEIADSLNNDPDFAATMTTELAKKVNTSDLVAIPNTTIDSICANPGDEPT